MLFAKVNALEYSLVKFCLTEQFMMSRCGFHILECGFILLLSFQVFCFPQSAISSWTKYSTNVFPKLPCYFYCSFDWREFPLLVGWASPFDCFFSAQLASFAKQDDSHFLLTSPCHYDCDVKLYYLCVVFFGFGLSRNYSLSSFHTTVISGPH